MGALGLGLSTSGRSRVSQARTLADFLGRAYRLNGRWVTEAEFFEAGTVSGAGGTIVRAGALVRADAPRVGDQGLLIEDARTNWVSAFTAPTDLARVSLRFAGGTGAATLSLVEDIAELEAAGLGAITGGRAYKLDNQAGATPARIQFSGASPDDQPLALSAWIRGGGGRLRTAFTDPQSGGFAASSGYRRVTALQSDGLVAGARSANDLLWIEAAPGQTLWAACPQMETGSWVSSLIPINGAPATRTRDQISFPRTALGLELEQGALRVELGEHRRGRVAARIIGTDGPNGASLLNFVGNSDTQIGTYNGEQVLAASLSKEDEQTNIHLKWREGAASLCVNGSCIESEFAIRNFSSMALSRSEAFANNMSYCVYLSLTLGEPLPAI